MYRPSLSTKYASIIFLPTRLVTIFTLLALVPVFSVSWEIATEIFKVFFPVYIASFVIEGMLSKEGLKKNFDKLGSKYTMSVPVEFAGVASFALLSFSTKPDEALLMGIYVSATVIACSVFVEMYYRFIDPKLAKIKLSKRQEILAIIGMTISVVFLGIYYLNSNPLI